MCVPWYGSWLLHNKTIVTVDIIKKSGGGGGEDLQTTFNLFLLIIIYFSNLEVFR